MDSTTTPVDSGYGANTGSPHFGTTDDSSPTRKDASDSSVGHRLHRRLAADIDPKWGDLVLIGCFFCAGLIDSVAFNVYSCFVSMQTGNTIFTGLGVSGLPLNSPRYDWTKSLCAILSFLVGALFFSTFHRWLSPLKRWVVVSSFAIQTAIIIVAAILVTTHTVSWSASQARLAQDGSDFPWIDLLPICILAFQSAGQVVASRVLQYNGLPTVVLTSLYCDMMSDPSLFTAGLFHDAQRNRRAASAIVLFSGAVAGGYFAKSSFGFAGALWLAAGIKAVMVFAWFLWKPKTVHADGA